MPAASMMEQQQYSSMSQMTASLRQEVTKSKAEFDEWAAAQALAFKNVQSSYQQCVEECVRSAEALREADERVRAARADHARVSQRHALELERESAEVRQLRAEQEEALPLKLAALEAALDRQRAALAAVEAARECRDAAARTEVAHIDRSLSRFRHLGLEFERVDGGDGGSGSGGGGSGGSAPTLRLVFTQIDAAAPARAFAFTVSVDAGDAYEVGACALPRAAVAALVAELNATNDFSAFVRAMRRGFVAAARAGPCA